MGCFVCLSFILLAQNNPPHWLEQSERNSFYPYNSFVTGFTSDKVQKNNDIKQLTERLKKEAQRNLSENIRVRVQSETQTTDKSIRIASKEQISSTYGSTIQTLSDLELVGIKTESYYDPKEKTVYAFAYVNRYELANYYKSNLSMSITQAKGLLQTAQDLEATAEKAKARQQCEAAKPVLDKMRYFQDMLAAIDPNITTEDLQQAQTEDLYNTLAQMQARLAQAVNIYVESHEDLFGTRVDIVANKLKAELAVNGCSFTDNLKEADFQLKINASCRKFNTVDEIVFCYADVNVVLIKMRNNKTIYQDLISEKDGHLSEKEAARSALQSVSLKISKNILPWVKN